MTRFGKQKITMQFSDGYLQYLKLVGARAVLSFRPPAPLVGDVSHHKEQFSLLHDLLTEQAPTPAHIPCVVVAENDENHNEVYSVQVMTVPGQAGSFVAETIRPGHTLHNFMLERVGALNLAGDFEQIDGIGENLSQRHYNVYINEEQHRTLCALGTKESF
jgi:hypothetical protein